jgi:hypothetical protein
MQMRRLTRFDEWILEEVGEPVGCVLPAFRLLQLLPDSPLFARDACDATGITDHVWDLAELLA